MNGSGACGWRRDILVGALASLLTALVLAPIAWTARHEGRRQAEEARREAEAASALAREKAAEAERQRDLARRSLVAQAADLVGLEDKAGAEIMRVMTDAISPEVPRGGWLLIDKKATAWAAGDIAVIRQGDNNYVGRVIAFDEATGRMTVGRNGEKNREVGVADVSGRGVLSSR